MKNFLLVMLIPLIITILIDFYTNMFDIFIYYLVFGFMVVGLDLFTYGYHKKIQNNIKKIYFIYVIIYVSIYIIVLNVITQNEFFPLKYTDYLSSLIIALPITVVVYKQFFVKHVAYEQSIKYKK